MSAPRAFLILLCLGFFIAGAFLFVLPFLAIHEE
jgi:hypothetical protein